MNVAVRVTMTGMLAVAASLAYAQSAVYPNKPVRWVVPFPPGGSADIMGRMIGQDLAKALGQQVVIENRAGASAIVGSEYVAKSPADLAPRYDRCGRHRAPDPPTLEAVLDLRRRHPRWGATRIRIESSNMRVL